MSATYAIVATMEGQVTSSSNQDSHHSLLSPMCSRSWSVCVAPAQSQGAV